MVRRQISGKNKMLKQTLKIVRSSRTWVAKLFSFFYFLGAEIVTMDSISIIGVMCVFVWSRGVINL